MKNIWVATILFKSEQKIYCSSFIPFNRPLEYDQKIRFAIDPKKSLHLNNSLVDHKTSKLRTRKIRSTGQLQQKYQLLKLRAFLYKTRPNPLKT
jgi:hypothetical protein